MQTHQPANNQPKAGQLSPRVAELVAGEVGTAETRLRAAIEARTRAEQDLEHFKALCAANPDDAELGNKRRAARTFLDDAIDQHEIALAARDRTAKRLEDGSHDLLKLSQLERGIERWNDATWKQWEAQASKRVAAAVAELCTVWAETEQRQREQALARSAANSHAHAVGFGNYQAPDVEHEKRARVLRAAAHAAVTKAGLDWRLLRDLFTGY